MLMRDVYPQAVAPLAGPALFETPRGTDEQRTHGLAYGQIGLDQFRLRPL